MKSWWYTRNKIPNAVLNDKGKEIFYVDESKHKWRSDFENLYKPDCMKCDAKHYETIISEKI